VGFVTRAQLAPLATPQIRIEAVQASEQLFDFTPIDALEGIDAPSAPRNISLDLFEPTAFGFHDFPLSYLRPAHLIVAQVPGWS
jgi:hypothetical protein